MPILDNEDCANLTLLKSFFTMESAEELAILGNNHYSNFRFFFSFKNISLIDENEFIF